ncbi:hypothetical protein ACQCSX_11180 [Pseudarthrobacter sp. P1]|uniref:hypothetical protein n=1 Tax=Pseudarthrobacter sp. P1 TaxID=3418418 RepID=UPI003CEDAF07
MADQHQDRQSDDASFAQVPPVTIRELAPDGSAAVPASREPGRSATAARPAWNPYITALAVLGAVLVALSILATAMAVQSDLGEYSSQATSMGGMPNYYFVQPFTVPAFFAGLMGIMAALVLQALRLDRHRRHQK